MRLTSVLRALGVIVVILLSVVCSGAAATHGHAEASLPSGFQQEKVVGGLEAPTAFAFLPDGRVLVAEQSGVIRLVKDGALLEDPFLDISDRVNDFRERGLLGLAVDPEFDANGFVYLLYAY